MMLIYSACLKLPCYNAIYELKETTPCVLSVNYGFVSNKAYFPDSNHSTKVSSSIQKQRLRWLEKRLRDDKIKHGWTWPSRRFLSSFSWIGNDTLIGCSPLTRHANSWNLLDVMKFRFDYQCQIFFWKEVLHWIYTWSLGSSPIHLDAHIIG